jgi:hypothetical protein
MSDFRSPTQSSSNFLRIRHDGVWLADRTHILQWIATEAPPFAIIRRPPRFGKSFWLCILDIFFDIACPDNVHEYCFGTLKIGRDRPRERHLMLVIDFSTAKIGSYDTIVVESTVEAAIHLFISRYHYLLHWTPPKYNGAYDLFLKLLLHIQQFNYTVFLLIDEIDFGASWTISSFLEDVPFPAVPSTITAQRIFSIAKDIGFQRTVVRGFAMGVSPLHVKDVLTLSKWIDLSDHQKSYEMFGLDEDGKHFLYCLFTQLDLFHLNTLTR